jgi:hypothetical protein
MARSNKELPEATILAAQADSSHHPLLAVLAEANFVLHAWLRSGNSRTSQGAVQFSGEALHLLLGPNHHVRTVRADSGFYADGFLSFCRGTADDLSQEPALSDHSVASP